eukprot:g11013.t1
MAKFDPGKMGAALQQAIGPLVGGTVALGGLFYTANNCLYNVEAGHRAIKFNRLSGIGTQVLPSIVNEILKSVVAQFNASELVQQRERVSALIRDRLTKRARDFNILLDDVSITHVNFSPEYEKAVESKQVAQQQAERAKFRVLKAQEEKKNIVIKAQGEQEAARMIGNAIKNNPGFIELRRIDVAREVAQCLAKSQNRLVLSTDSLLLNLMEQDRHQNQKPATATKYDL